MPSPYFGIPDVPYNRCLQIATNIQNEWNTLVRIVIAENIAMGITSSGKTKLIADAMFPVMVYGSSGSLWEAYNAIDKIVVTPEMAPYITTARLNWMKNQIQQAIVSV